MPPRLRRRGESCFRRRHAERDVLFNLPLEMEAQLFIEFAARPGFCASADRSRKPKMLHQRRTCNFGLLYAIRIYKAHCVRQPLPLSNFFFELHPAGFGERIKFRFAAAFRGTPLRADPALLFQAMQRWIQRTLRHLQYVVTDLLYAFCMAQPCFGSSEIVVRMSRSSVP